MPSELSQGHRKLVGVARALTADPQLICMDEPAAGLDPAESRALGAELRKMVDTGVTIFLVDHDMSLVLTVCDYLYVIEFGQHHRPGDAGADPGRRAGDRRLPGRAARPRRPARGPGVSPPLLEIEQLDAGYRGATVVRKLDLVVAEHEVVALLGANGAGKTTTLLTVSGLLPLIGGDVRLAGRSVKGRSPQRIARTGVAHVPEDRSLFFGLTVKENLKLGARKAGPGDRAGRRLLPGARQADGPTQPASCREASSRSSPSAAR